MNSYDLAEITDRLDEINQNVSRLEKAVADSSTPALLEGMYKGLIWSGAFWLVFYLGDQAWHSKWRYLVQYDVDRSHVHTEKEPHDCDFSIAPVGAKHCKYERSVSTLRWSRATDGTPIVSSDEGKTWNTFTPETGVAVPTSSTVKDVFVGWQKKDDDD
jgi:hypothetical protein